MATEDSEKHNPTEPLDCETHSAKELLMSPVAKVRKVPVVYSLVLGLQILAENCKRLRFVDPDAPPDKRRLREPYAIVKATETINFDKQRSTPKHAK